MKKNLLILLVLLGSNVFSQTCVPNTNSLQFNGSSNYVSFTSDNNLQITDSITVEAWIYPTTWASNPYQGTIFCKHSWTAAGGEQGYVLRAGGTGQLSFNIAGKDSLGTLLSWQDLLSPVNALTLNTWTHVAGTFDGDSMRLFVNGVRIASKVMHGKIVPSTAFKPSISRISDTGSGQTRYWIGRLDEIRVWSRALSAGELLAHKGNHIDTTGANRLVGYWRLNEGTGTLTSDLSASGNNGTLNGPTWTTFVPFSNVLSQRYVIPTGLLLTCLPAAVTYQWLLGANPILNATSQTYTATQNGNYSVIASDSNGCSITAGPYAVTSIVGILELENNVNVNIINANGNLVINFLDGTIINQATLFDVSGRMIQSIEKSREAKFTSSALSNGVYILKISTDKGTYSKNIYLGK